MAPPERSPELDLRRYATIVWRRKWSLLVTAVVLSVGAVVFASLQSPVYQGVASLLLQPRLSQSVLASSGVQAAATVDVPTETQLLQSASVRHAVQQAIGSAPPVSTVQMGTTAVVQIIAQGSSPAGAARVANAYARAYIQVRQQQAVNDLSTTATAIQSKITGIKAQVASIDNQVSHAPPGERASLSQSLAPQRAGLSDQLQALTQQQSQLQLNASLATGGGELVGPASPNPAQISPKPTTDALLGLAAGLVLGCCLAFVREYLDDSIKTKEDVEQVLPRAPTLALIPVVAEWQDQTAPMLVSVIEPKSPAAEAYRSLRTSVQFLGMDRPLRALQVTSPASNEGKTTTLANLAIALARAGQRTIVVCCDLRRPRLHEFFGCKNVVGFTSVIVGDAALSAALQDVPGEDGLMLLSSGPIPPNPSELLAGERATEILAALRARADIVLIDSPPVLPVTDAAILSKRVDATLLVVRAGGTTRRQLTRAAELLNQVDANVVGTVLGGVSGSDLYGYDRYQDGYLYGADQHAPASGDFQAGRDLDSLR